MPFVPAVDFGSDIAGITDLDASLGVVSGNLALAQCLARGFSTQKGTLPWAPDWGEDARALLNDTVSQVGLQALRVRLETQAKSDERVVDATVSVSYDSNTQALGVVVQVLTANGPFTLTLAISAVTVSILNLNT